MPQFCDMGQTALVPFPRKACWGFFFARRLRLGANPRSWVPETSMLTTRPPEPLCVTLTTDEVLLLLLTYLFLPVLYIRISIPPCLLGKWFFLQSVDNTAHCHTVQKFQIHRFHSIVPTPVQSMEFCFFKCCGLRGISEYYKLHNPISYNLGTGG
jgi:hypothetical protein